MPQPERSAAHTEPSLDTMRAELRQLRRRLAAMRDDVERLTEYEARLVNMIADKEEASRV